MNGGGYGPDGYMEPEEEWEREGLLDPAWEKQQKKVKTTPFLVLQLPPRTPRTAGPRRNHAGRPAALVRRCWDRCAPSRFSRGWLCSEGLMRVALRVVCGWMLLGPCKFRCCRVFQLTAHRSSRTQFIYRKIGVGQIIIEPSVICLIRPAVIHPQILTHDQRASLFPREITSHDMLTLFYSSDLVEW